MIRIIIKINLIWNIINLSLYYLLLLLIIYEILIPN